MLSDGRKEGSTAINPAVGAVMKCYLAGADRDIVEMDLHERFGADIYTQFIHELKFEAELFEESDDFDSRIRLNFHVKGLDIETGKELFGITPNHFLNAELIQKINELLSSPLSSNFIFAIRLIEDADYKEEWCELSIYTPDQYPLSNVQWGADEQRM